MPYTRIFIDLDDTLWDFRANSKATLRAIYQQFSIHRFYSSAEEFASVYMQRNNELWTLYHHGKIEKSQLVVERFRYPLTRVGIHNDRLAVEMNTTYLEILSQQTRLVPYARQLLEYLSDKYPLAIISNGFSEVQYKKLTTTGIDRYFDRIILSEEVGITKPHPRIFEFALEATACHRSAAIMIGDNFDADIAGARSSGIDQLFFNPLHIETNLFIPTYTVFSLKEIPALL